MQTVLTDLMFLWGDNAILFAIAVSEKLKILGRKYVSGVCEHVWSAVAFAR